MLECQNIITYDKLEEVNYQEILQDIIELQYPWIIEEKGGLEAFLTPSLRNIHPSEGLKNIRKACALIVKAIEAGGKIIIFGDYDVDGVTSAALWTRFLSYIQFTNFEVIIPSRFEQGYGLTESALDLILPLEPSLIITADNGINSYREVETLQSKGIDVVITDHHNLISEVLPDCPIVNPKLPDCEYPDKAVTGVGVTFLVVAELRKILRDKGFWEKIEEPNLIADLDLVALGTIADQAPLKGINRIFVHYGLIQIKNRVHQYCQGFYSYLDALYEDMPNLRNYPVDSEFVSFKIAPLLNSAGRMENGAHSVSFLTSQDQAGASFWLQKLKLCNKKRLEVQSQMYTIAHQQAKEQEIRGGLIIYDPSFHEGVTGIIAGKLANEFKLPCVVLASQTNNGELKGSCRIPEEASILSVLDRCKEMLINFGGHDFAAGCALYAKNLMEFRNLFYRSSLLESVNISNQGIFVADFEIPLDLVNDDFFDQLSKLEPHGSGHTRPIFVSRDVKVPKLQPFGRNNMKWEVRENVTAIFWNYSFQNSLANTSIDIAYEIKAGNISGNDSLVMNVKKISLKGLLVS